MTNSDEEEDTIFIGCMTVQMGLWNPKNIVPGCVVKHCCECNTDIHVSPSSQKLLAEKPDVKVICVPCMMKQLIVAEAKETKEEVKWMGAVPGSIEEAKEHIRRIKEEKKKP